jgi:LuxR family maltose regulon positive regulatory protein
VTTSILGDASLLNANLEEAFHAYTTAIQIGKGAGNFHVVIIANSNLANILMEQGQLHKAADVYKRSLEMAIRPDGQRSPLAGNLFAGLGKIAYERNQLHDADQYFRQCIDLCRQWGDFDLQAVACAMLARLKVVSGNIEVAQENFRQAEVLADEHLISPLRFIQLKSEYTRYWRARGNLEKLSQLIQKSSLSINDEISFQRQPEYIILLRTLLAQNDYEAALVLSIRLLNQTMQAGRMGLVIEILILQALTFHARKETEQALTALERALALAQPEEYVRSFLDEGEAMTRLLCQAQSRQVGNGYVGVLLSKIGKISGMTQPSMQLLIEPLTPRELEVLKLIKTGCSNQEIAEQLVISIPTVKRHISNVYSKLGVKSRTQALAIGKELRIFD